MYKDNIYSEIIVLLCCAYAVLGNLLFQNIKLHENLTCIKFLYKKLATYIEYSQGLK